jgi:hypothetical protein
VKQALIDGEYRAILQATALLTPEHPMLKGHKVYCQFDEGGIIQHITQNIGVSKGSFVELGCGDGRENNSHALLLNGWSGVWVDGSPTNLAHILASVPKESKRLLVEQMFIDADNIKPSMQAWLKRVGPDLDLFSIDLDGNDATILQQVLSVSKPKIIVAEYNGKFAPPIRTQVKYNPTHTWAGDDYYGVSLQTLVDILVDYRLVCCNGSGINSFFVRKDLSKPFKAYSPEQLFMPARNYLAHRRIGAAASLKHLANSLSGE